MRADNIPAKVLDQLFGRARCGVRCDARLPGEPAQQCLGRAKAGAEFAQVQIAVALGKAAAIRRYEQRNVRVARRGKSQQMLQVDLAGRGAQQVASAHDLGDAHGGVVDHHG